MTDSHPEASTPDAGSDNSRFRPLELIAEPSFSEHLPCGDRQEAQIIGRGRSQHAPLANAGRDARAVGKILSEEFDFALMPSGRALIDQNLDVEEVQHWITEQLLAEEPPDRWLFYFAGHGRIVDGQGFLVIGSDEHDEARQLSLRWLVRKALASRAREILIVIDACYAGRALMNPEIEPWIDPAEESRRGSVQILVSGGPNQVVLDGGGGENSVFTRCFLDALRGHAGIHEQDGAIRFTPLREYMDREVAKRLGDSGSESKQQLLGVDVRPSSDGSRRGEFKFVPRWPRIQPSVVNGLGFPDPGVQCESLEELVIACSEEPPALSRDERLRWNLPLAISILLNRLRAARASSPGASGALTGAFPVRLQQTKALGDLCRLDSTAKRDPRMVNALIDFAIRDPDLRVRHSACRELAAMITEIDELETSISSDAVSSQREQFRSWWLRSQIPAIRQEWSMLGRVFALTTFAATRMAVAVVDLRHHRWRRRLLALALVFLAAGSVGTWSIKNKTDELRIVSLTRTARELAATGSHEEAALLARQAFCFALDHQNPREELVDTALRASLDTRYFRTSLTPRDWVGTTSLASSVAFDWVSSKLVVGGSGSSPLIWDLNFWGTAPVRLGNGAALSRKVAISTGGRWVATADSDHGMRIWSPSDPITPRYTFDAADYGEFLYLDFVAKGTTLWSAHMDGTIAVWDIQTGKGTPIALGHIKDWGASQAVSVLYSASSNSEGLMVAGGSDNHLYVWEWKDETLVAGPRLEGHSAPIGTVAVSPDGSVLASGSHNGQVVLWRERKEEDGRGWQPIRASEIEMWRLRKLEFDSTGRQLAMGDMEGRSFVWDLESVEAPTERAAFSTRGAVMDLTFAPSSDSLIIVGSSVDLWDFDESPDRRTKVLRAPNRGEHFSPSLAFGPDDRILALRNGEKIEIWDLETQEITPLQLETKGPSEGPISISPEGKLLAAGAGRRQPSIRIWNLESGNHWKDLEGLLDWPTSIAFDSRGRYLAAASLGGDIKIWKPADIDAEAIELRDGQAVTAIAFAPHGENLASADALGRVQLWDLDRPARSPALLGKIETSWVSTLGFTSDGEHLIGVGEKGEIRVWQIEGAGARVVAEAGPRGHALTDYIGGSSIDPSGQWIAIGESTGVVRLFGWSPHLRQVASFTDHDLPTVPAFGSTGSILATADVAEGLRLGSAHSEGLAEMVCNTVWRNLTQEEWDRWMGGSRYTRTCPNLPSGAGAPIDSPACFSNLEDMQ